MFSSGFKLFFWGGQTIFAPSDIVVQGHFQVLSVIWAPYKSNLGTLFIVVSSLRGAMAPSGLLDSSAIEYIYLETTFDTCDSLKYFILLLNPDFRHSSFVSSPSSSLGIAQVSCLALFEDLHPRSHSRLNRGCCYFTEALQKVFATQEGWKNHGGTYRNVWNWKRIKLEDSRVKRYLFDCFSIHQSAFITLSK